MKFRNNKSGFSFIELIIVLAIMGLLASAIVANVVILGQQNAKKVAYAINDKLNNLQTDNITKRGDEYMYIYRDYKTKDIIYVMWTMKESEVQDPSGSVKRKRVPRTLEKRRNGYSQFYELCQEAYQASRSLSNDDVKIYVSKGGTKTELKDGMIKIKFDRTTGAFTCRKMVANKSENVDDESAAIVDFDQIIIDGRTDYAIKLVGATGKRTVELV